ncbi:hypothetical protein COU05_01775 [bacterium (Candidatus Gribaldobacteria) CG10_big_fil_rev_8_21_14_0_10_37_21]|uniref:DUF4129 domain-containing protein n=1 Tax=bacterium (Candidatus Gribaldobacteria) CG10_big_fil_rev_8_21_14_0_10_37_21 TaxID=2014275 RepID=A0A2H0UUK0_9BACT|nr:MAG: hypothetical protein AUJ25_03285 [Parcubacteria group bacterium CG1_02_37_13]PIR90493.1 MAG: hypothetical protein COU05_01775 [bacterium (Candidatus Gribaldobacteria) CG10_big_fil_rev_8_21_14_0_10_37_21]
MPDFIDLTTPGGGINEQNLQTAVSGLRGELDFLVSKQLQDKLFWYKWSSIFVSILFLVLIFAILKKDGFDFFVSTSGDEIQDRKSYKDLGLKKAQKQWQKIKLRFQKPSESYLKLGLIEAENFLDEVLKRMGLGGEDLEQRLKHLKEGDVPSIVRLMEAHQTCQDIIRDPDYKISKEEALSKFNIFENSLQALNSL